MSVQRRGPCSSPSSLAVDNGSTGARCALDCGGTVSFTELFVYLGSLLHYDLSDHHDVEARIKRAPKALGAMRSKICGSADIPEGLKCTRAASWRSCCTAARRGASRQSRCGG